MAPTLVFGPRAEEGASSSSDLRGQEKPRRSPARPHPSMEVQEGGPRPGMRRRASQPPSFFLCLRAPLRCLVGASTEWRFIGQWTGMIDARTTRKAALRSPLLATRPTRSCDCLHHARVDRYVNSSMTQLNSFTHRSRPQPPRLRGHGREPRRVERAARTGGSARQAITARCGVEQQAAAGAQGCRTDGSLRVRARVHA